MHIIWDWNGTLFDDIHIVVEAVNEVLHRLGSGPICQERYRSHFTRPVHHFYERILGRTLQPHEFHGLDEHFHSSYRARMGAAGLGRDAEHALTAAAAAGFSQSLLSMWRHVELVPTVRAHRIDGHMRRVDGLRDGRGDAKGPHMARHAEALALPRASERVVVIGDALDDAAAAGGLGFHCVLYDGGTHHVDALRAHGAPVATTLLEAVEHARTLVDG